MNNTAENGNTSEKNFSAEKRKILAIPPPTEKQKTFFLSDTRYIVYGGARGGGKSWAVRVKALLLALRYDGIRILILRRSYPELFENHIRSLIAMTSSFAVYREKEKALTVGASLIKFGYCDRESDVLRYQGQEYDILFIDEATQLSEYQFNWLDACVRGTGDFPKRTYITCNPGGIGHDWVKRRFVDAHSVGDGLAVGDGTTDGVTFIRATVYDNTPLLKHNPEYLDTLRSLPDGLRRAWLDGDWDYYGGRYFSCFDRNGGCCEPFDIPVGWNVYRSIDYGLDMLAVIWFAVSPSGEMYAYRELCCPDLIVSEAAKTILSVGRGERVKATFAPPDLWSRQKDSGRTVAELFEENGVPLTSVDNSRVSGWLTLAELLTPKKNNEECKMNNEECGACRRPTLMIFTCCRELIRCLPLLQRDEHNPSDCATEPHDITHICDAARYFAVSRPALPPTSSAAESPFSLWRKRRIFGEGKRRRF